MMTKIIIALRKKITKWSEVWRLAHERWLAEHRISYTYDWIKEMKNRVDHDKKGMDIDLAAIEDKKKEIADLEGMSQYEMLTDNSLSNISENSPVYNLKIGDKIDLTDEVAKLNLEFIKLVVTGPSAASRDLIKKLTDIVTELEASITDRNNLYADLDKQIALKRATIEATKLKVEEYTSSITTLLNKF